MAAKILDDILNNFLPLESVLQWLSFKDAANKENIFSNKYECSQVDFVSYFLVFLREQSSRNFQVYDVETPRKNSQSRVIKASNDSIKKSNSQFKAHKEFSPNVNYSDSEYLQSFPSLSSCSSIAENSKQKKSEFTPNSSLPDANKNTSEKKCRRIKLFSETVEGNSKASNFYKKELDFLDDVELRRVNENRFTMSTPKSTGNNSLFLVDCFNNLEPLGEIFPKFVSKPKQKNYSLNSSSPEINMMAPKSKSFNGDIIQRSKENKVNCRMSLGDFIFNESNLIDIKKEKKNKTKKRINPVRLSSQIGVNVNFPFIEKTEGLVENNEMGAFEEGRFLKVDLKEEEEVKVIKSIENLEISMEKQPELELVTHTRELKIVSQIYSCLINENYCQNIMIELCFVFSLLLIEDSNKKMSDLKTDNLNVVKEKKLFGSIDNCVFFAVETLWLQKNLLLFLNLSALKLLSENVRIEKFSVKLKEFLASACFNRQSDEEIKKPNGLIKAGMQGNVSFQYETDNLENFTSAISFHSFRKQRDLFYNILAIWEANHLASGWVFSVGLGSKIRSLFSISSDPINLLHLSRLFRNQMIMSCCGENQTEEEFNKEILQLFPSADPNKILRLRARLTSSPKRQGPCPLPDFTGHQEFYKEFILCTSHSNFHEHLKNSLCDEILRLNDAELIGDIEDDDSCLDEQTRERYLQHTNILRLLAKFLGFVEFLPYRGEKQFSDRILNIHCSVRHNVLPLFDAVSCLKAALKKRKLTLTIPWMVSYLSMIDPYSAHLKTYQNIWHLLILIYKRLKSYTNVKNGFYLKLTLGWIFQLPNFPSDQFYSVLDDQNKNSSDLATALPDVETKPGLDSFDFIEETVLYTVCPYLNELNVILSENLGCSVKHIRPVTTQENLVTKSHASKQLELRLEGNFLHNQSSSTRKTVEFVTERVASIAVKHLIHNVIPKIKESMWSQLENFFTSDLKEAETRSEALSESCYKELLNICEEENWRISCKRSEVGLRALLSDDLQGSVADTCTKIVARQATEKVQRWMQSHVTLAMIKKEFVSLTRKRFAKKSADQNTTVMDSGEVYTLQWVPQRNLHHFPANGREVVKNEEAWPASLSLKAVRELIWKLYEGTSSTVEVEKIIEETVKTITRRNDVIPSAEKALFSLVVDLIVSFCVLFNSDVGEDIFKKFSTLCRCLGKENLCQSGLERLICPRNSGFILYKAKNKHKAWENLGKFLIFLMEDNFLTKEQVEAQLLSLFRNNWEKEDGVQFSKLFLQILEHHSKENGCDEFSLFLECMIDTLNDDEPKAESLV